MPNVLNVLFQIFRSEKDGRSAVLIQKRIYSDKK